MNTHVDRLRKSVLVWNGATTRRIVLAGVAIGIAVLTKGVILLLPVVFIVAAIIPKPWRSARALVLATLLAVLYFWGVHAVIVGWLRYAVPVMPLLILLAAGGITRRLKETVSGC